MGRGRQRAKDAKIARQLKYATNGSDLRALERELVSSRSDSVSSDNAQPDAEGLDDHDEWDDER